MLTLVSGTPCTYTHYKWMNVFQTMQYPKPCHKHYEGLNTKGLSWTIIVITSLLIQKKLSLPILLFNYLYIVYSGRQLYALSKNVKAISLFDFLSCALNKIWPLSIVICPVATVTKYKDSSARRAVKFNLLTFVLRKPI